MHNLNDLETTLSYSGLIVRGYFKPNVSDLPDHIPFSDNDTLVLVGNGGSSLWSTFSNSPEFTDGFDHPLDRWSRRVGNEIARSFDGLALYPFDGPPYLPFLSWTGKAEALIASPLGMRLHPEFGLWHAYRFALLLPIKLPSTLSAPLNNFSCLECVARPCLNACPVEAFSETGYDVPACMNFLSNNINAECNKTGCASRHACPVGQSYAYLPDQAQFHMNAFKKARENF